MEAKIDFIQDIIDKTNRLEGAKNDLQKQVDLSSAKIIFIKAFKVKSKSVLPEVYSISSG